MPQVEHPHWDDFLAVSAQIGKDIALVQGAGGNSSLKSGNVMWIKASGTWLAEAQAQSIMVPVDLVALQKRVAAGNLSEDEIAGLTLPIGPTGLRASVETPFHALLPSDCVLHVHCVATIATAIRADADDVLRERLSGLNWHWQPYVKPGVPLTNAMRDAGAAEAEIIVLGNHGLIAQADTPAHAMALLSNVRERLGGASLLRSASINPESSSLAAEGYVSAQDQGSNDLALVPELLALAANCALAPDFVVFFGPSIPILPRGPDLAGRLAGLASAPLPHNAVVLVEGRGAMIRRDAMRGTKDLLAGYAQVLKRHVSNGGGTIRYFTSDEIAELLDWDAEKYRQAMNRGA